MINIDLDPGTLFSFNSGVEGPQLVQVIATYRLDM